MARQGFLRRWGGRFCERSSVISYSRKALEKVWKDAVRFAEAGPDAMPINPHPFGRKKHEVLGEKIENKTLCRGTTLEYIN